MIIPTPGNRNLDAIRPNSRGDDVWDSSTLRANMNVTEEITVRITCVHQENQVANVSFWEARSTSGSELVLDSSGANA